MYLIAGLGNPGQQYEKTRHNVGFMVMDRIASNLDVSLTRRNCRCLYEKVLYGGKKVILAKPQTYMNLSGDSIREMAFYYAIAPQNMIVVYDDVDLPLGRLRIRPHGGSGTHNGMRGIVNAIGEDFPRIRIGIGSEKPPRMDLADYVLGKFSNLEWKEIEPTLNHAADAALHIITDGLDSAMQRYNCIDLG